MSDKYITDEMVEANALVMFDCHMKSLGYGGQNYWTATYPEASAKRMWLRYSHAALKAAGSKAWRQFETAPKDAG